VAGADLVLSSPRAHVTVVTAVHVALLVVSTWDAHPVLGQGAGAVPIVIAQSWEKRRGGRRTSANVVSMIVGLRVDGFFPLRVSFRMDGSHPPGKVPGSEGIQLVFFSIDKLNSY
jgi:hypothetical protein